MSNDVALLVNGADHFGWQDVSVRQSVDCLAQTFDLGLIVSDATKSKGLPVREGDRCTLKLDGEVVVTGFVDHLSVGYSAEEISMSVSGRSATGDLVDSAEILSNGQFRNKELGEIAKIFCAPFGISVVVNADLGEPFKRFVLNDGELIFEALERGCRLRGAVMSTSPAGELVFTKIGAKQAGGSVEYGKNVLRGSLVGDFSSRHSSYLLKGQLAGSDDTYGESAAHLKASEIDDGVKRHRPTIIHAECESLDDLRQRAIWERNIRAGRSQRLTYTLDGWRDDDGALWTPNKLVRVVDPILKVDTELLIAAVRLTKGEQGTQTELELCDPKAFTREPLTPQPQGKSNKDLPYLRGSRPQQ